MRAGLLARLRADPEVRRAMTERAEAVAAGEVTPDAAAAEMLMWLKG